MSKTVQFQTIQFSISSHFRCNYCLIVKKKIYFELFSFSKAVLIQLIQFSVSIVSMSKTVQFQTIQFSISLQFRCNYCLIVKKKNFYFELFSFSKAVLIQLIQFSVSIVSMSKTVQFQIIQFSVSIGFVYIQWWKAKNSILCTKSHTIHQSLLIFVLFFFEGRTELIFQNKRNK